MSLGERIVANHSFLHIVLMHKKLAIIGLFLLLVLITWFAWQYSPKPAPADETLVTLDIEASQATSEDVINPAAAPLPRPILNLEIPEEHFLMDATVEVPEKESWLKGLFKPQAKEKSVKVGGSLILDEKPADPNAAVWDQVKGAEVGITIQTP